MSPQELLAYQGRCVQIVLIQTVLALVDPEYSCKDVVCDVNSCMTGNIKVNAGMSFRCNPQCAQLAIMELYLAKAKKHLARQCQLCL